MWQKLYRICLLSLVLSLVVSPVLLFGQSSPSPMITLSQTELALLIRDMQTLTNELKSSQLTLAQAQRQQSSLERKAAQLVKRLELSELESNELTASLNQLRIAYDDYKKAAQEQIRNLQTFVNIAIPVGSVLLVTAVVELLILLTR